MNNQDFDVLMEKEVESFGGIKQFLTSIFNFFNKTERNRHLNTYFSVCMTEQYIYNWSSIKEENLIMVKAKRSSSTSNFFCNINFGYNDFGYSFFPMDHVPYAEYTFEFKVN